MSALFRKELRALRPIALLIVATFALALGYTFATEFPDEQPFTVEALEEDEGGRLVMTLLFAMLVGAGLLLRESEEGTLHFLDGLPVSRSRIFRAKVGAGLLVLSVVPGIDAAATVAFGFLARSSIDPPPPWACAGAVFGLNFVAVFSCLALALALAFLRRWFAFAVGLIVWGFLWFEARGVAWIDWFSPLSLAPEMREGKAFIPWKHVAAQTATGTLALGVAWLGFQRLGARSRDFADRLRTRRIGRWLLAGAALATPAIWIAAIVLLAQTFGGNDGDDADEKPLGEAAFARLETKRYEFLFRESQRSDAEEIIDAADAVHDALAEFYGAPPSPARIVVDLAGAVIAHAAGQTNWTKVRLPLHPGQDLAERRLILGHETAHVFHHQLADNRLDPIYPHVRFFDEGLATYVEQRFFSAEADRRSMDRHAAAATALGAIGFELLSDDTELEKKRDPELAYSLGSVFCRALVASYGDDAPARVLAAMKQHRRVPDEDGPALWRAAMQRCGFSLDRAVAAYDAEIARLQRVEADFIQQLPRLTGKVEVVGEEIVVRPEFEGAAPGRVVCAVPKLAGIAEGTVIYTPQTDGAIRLPRRLFKGGSARTMLGWAVQDVRLPLFEPWTETAL